MALGNYGIAVSANTVARLLHQMSYSLRVHSLPVVPAWTAETGILFLLPYSTDKPKDPLTQVLIRVTIRTVTVLATPKPH